MANRALHYDGVDDYSYNATVLDTAPVAVSFEFWFKPDITFDSGASVNEYFFGKTNVLGQDRIGCHLDPTTGKLRVWNEFNNGGVWEIFSAQTSWTGGTWYYIAITYDGTWRMYVNSSLEGDTEVVAGFMNNGTYTDFTIGLNVAGGGNPFDGILDEIRISDKARSQAEINTAYNSGTGKAFEVDGNTIALWHLDDDSLADETGNYNLTNFEAAWVDGFPFPVGIPMAVFMHHYRMMRET